MTQSAFEHRSDLTIAWGDCDPAGIVFYPQYFRFFNAATDALFAAAGFPPATAFDRFGIVGYPMIDTRATFTSPNRFGDPVTIVSSIGRWGRSSFEVRHRLHNRAGLSVEGFEKRVWAEAAPGGGLRGKSVPAEVCQAMRPLEPA